MYSNTMNEYVTSQQTNFKLTPLTGIKRGTTAMWNANCRFHYETLIPRTFHVTLLRLLHKNDYYLQLHS